jgi:hypothetical protein
MRNFWKESVQKQFILQGQVRVTFAVGRVGGGGGDAWMKQTETRHFYCYALGKHTGAFLPSVCLCLGLNLKFFQTHKLKLPPHGPAAVFHVTEA